jgi:hypothetical protein
MQMKRTHKLDKIEEGRQNSLRSVESKEVGASIHWFEKRLNTLHNSKAEGGSRL